MLQNHKTLKFGSLNSFELSISHLKPENFPLEDEPPLHIHDAFEIYLNLSGNISFIVENHTYPISRGSVIITKPYEYHHCVCHDNKEHEHYWLLFSGCEGNDMFKSFFERKKGENNHIILNNENVRILTDSFEKLINPSSDSHTEKYLHFINVLNIIENNMSCTESENTYSIPEPLKKVLDIISEKYSEPLTVSGLASEIYVSVTTLERYFKQYLNITPCEYIKRKSLSEAMHMLSNHSATVSQVALQCGFSDVSNFIRVFKRSFGKTPYRYIVGSKNNEIQKRYSGKT